MDDQTDKPQDETTAEQPKDLKINDSNAAVDTATQVDFLVKQMISQIDQTKEQLKEHRQMLKDAYATNMQHKELSDQIKDLAKKKKEISQAISNQESVKQTKEEIRTLSEDLKTVEKKLSGYLQQYVEAFNSRTIEDAEGRLKEIVTVYKLIARATS